MASIAYRLACCVGLLCTTLLAQHGAKRPDPASVLVLVNDKTPPEEGTAGKGASQYVADYYAAARGIPRENIVHIRSGVNSDPHAWDGWHVSWEAYLSEIREPIKRFLAAKGAGSKIKYIVPTYGVPSHIQTHPLGHTALSVDSFLVLLNTSMAVDLNVQSPMYDADTQSEQPVRLSAFRGRLYLVSRLDGPSASIAVGLVDKALSAERGVSRTSGWGYFDWQHLAGGPTYVYDQSMLSAYNLCVAAGMQCNLNDQSITAHLIDLAPNTLWSWGWYGGTTDVYSFVPGAVGAQLTSYTAASIRAMTPGAWVPLWLDRGITATWGATGEPYANYYASGDILLNRMWNGFSFGEASYASCPTLGWKMVFVGDPLYTPRFLP